VKKRHKALLMIGFLVFGVPLILWLSWLLTTPQPVSLFLMDKTSYTRDMVNRRAVNWVLKHHRFVKPNGKDYNPLLDYYGFFPVDKSNYTIRDLSKLSPLEIQRLALQYDVAYYVDSYGVFSDMWPEENLDTSPAKMLYGGLDRQDLLFLEYMLRLNRLVIAEFVFMAPPTAPAIRLRAEELLGVKWQNWTGRYFHTLDPGAPDKNMPDWIPSLYERKYGEKWPYTKAGIVLIHSNETIVVLEKNTHLKDPRCLLLTEETERRKYGMSDKINYPGWFEITLPTSPTAEVVTWFGMDVTDEGKQLLSQYDLSDRFPAVIRDMGANKMFYFAGDFGNTSVKRRFVRFKGSRYAELFLADLNDPTDNSSFFLAYYLPLFKNILRNYQKLEAGKKSN